MSSPDSSTANGGTRYCLADAAALFAEFRSAAAGLSRGEAERRLAVEGLNRLPQHRPVHPATLFLRQFQSPLIAILGAAAAAVTFLGSIADGVIIFFVLIFNAVVGTIQEGRAARTLQALRDFAVTSATVVRDGKEEMIPDEAVVTGDVILLREGEKVSADARLFLARTLKLDESAFTGESLPVHKVDSALPPRSDGIAIPLTEQQNMVFKGTAVLSGYGRGLVVRTGPRTVLGKIAATIGERETEIPLKRKIRVLSRFIVAVVAAIGSTLFLIGVSTGQSPVHMFSVVVSLAVSIIPEGLPIVLTIVLAAGVWRMGKRDALVKRLQAVEALGEARVIAVDKTGTLTKGELAVERVAVGGTVFAVGGSGYEPQGDVLCMGDDGRQTPIVPPEFPGLLLMGRTAAFCANARLSYLEAEGRWRVSGDPTEAALAVFGQKIGFSQDDIEREHELLSEVPFSYETRYHATVHRDRDGSFLTVVGAPETVLGLCRLWWRDGRHEALLDSQRKILEAMFLKFSAGGLRVLAAAIRHHPSEILSAADLPPPVFLGFFGMKDGLRPTAADAVRRARAAGARVVMVTGDHRLTAEAVAREAGIFHEGDTILVGAEIDRCAESELDRAVVTTSVFARVSPDHKLKIIAAFRRRGEIVAMTGDGVNDAPSLAAADLGVAMGKTGTEVAKEAADIVLLDDNFGTIVSAMEEGRSIYRTMQKVILYLFSTSLGEVLVISGAALGGYPIPLLPAQIVWLNLVTDGFLDVALAAEPKEPGLLERPFLRPPDHFLDRPLRRRMVVMALPMMIGTLALFVYYLGDGLLKAQTVALTVLAAFQWFNAWNCRSEDRSLFRSDLFSNRALVAATIAIVTLQLGAIYLPFAHGVLHTTALSIRDWVIIIAVASTILLVEEVRKFFRRRRTA